jgi:creatinine amidohydrolase/Fe(II)-dependent formamide hydrolase-like protein
LFLAEMTWEEVNSYDRAAIVVAPFGAMEQHSFHLPLETDALIAQELSRRLDAACGGRLLILLPSPTPAFEIC